jgi:hypothetical protein
VCLVLAVLTVAGCASRSTRSSSASPTAVVAQVVSPADLVFADGRRGHVPGLLSTDPSDNCELGADMVLAERLVAGQTVTLTKPTRPDHSGVETPAGFVDLDVTLPGQADYREVFRIRMRDNRSERCSGASSEETTSTAPTTTTTEPTTSAPEDGDTYVDVDTEDDDDRESRYCRKHWYC